MFNCPTLQLCGINYNYHCATFVARICSTAHDHNMIFQGLRSKHSTVPRVTYPAGYRSSSRRKNTLSVQYDNNGLDLIDLDHSDRKYLKSNSYTQKKNDNGRRKKYENTYNYGLPGIGKRKPSPRP